jgi:hypothetical protein
VSANLKCTHAKCKDRKPSKSLRALESHRRTVHGIYKRGKRGPNGHRRGRKNGAPEGTVIQEPINFCCFCGKSLPNATIIK